MLVLAVVCVLLGIAVLVLLGKIKTMQKSMGEMLEAMETHLSTDTNQLITVSSGDRHVKRLADGIAEQLAILRRQRRNYLEGDRELKEAVTNISHDLRTPLTAICGYLELLERQETSPEVARYLACIGERAEALRNLTEELFRYSVILSAKTELCPEPLSLGGVVEESLAAFYGAFCERGIVPTVHLPDETVVRLLDRRALSRVLGNIFGNVLKYSDGDLEVTLTEAGEMSFANTARKLDPVAVGRLFDRFFSVEAARPSTGLGLAIAKTLVEQMGGTITAEYADAVLTVRIRF